MYKKLVELDPEKHSDLMYKPIRDYSFIRELVSVPVTASELGQVVKFYPIIFPAGDTVAPHALMGLEQGKNSFISKDGKWMVPYIPMCILCYPFALVKNGDSQKVFIDEEAPHWQSPGSVKLFENGKFTGFMEQTLKFLENFQHNLSLTMAAAKTLSDKGVLEERNLNIRFGDKAFTVTNCKIVNRERLRALDDDVLANWVRSGLLSIIELHLVSLANLRELAAQHIGIYGKS